ncbi:MAG: winged helix-turn-helix transcriptional regulator [Nanoarchaeota archaeon]
MAQKIAKIDLIGRKILYELDKNARVPTSEIAKKLRKSKQFIDYRIKKLTEEKIILGYNTIVDISTLGYCAFRINLKLKSITEEERGNMIKQMVADMEPWWYGHAEGVWNVCYAIALRSVDDFNKYWEKILKRHGHLFKDYSVIYYRNLIWYPSKFLIDDTKNEMQYSLLSRGPVKIDDTDKKILKAISKNARFSYLDLEKKLNISRGMVKRRIEALEKRKVIVGYKIWFNEKKLGYRFYKTYLKFTRWDEYNKLYEYCKKNPYMITVNKTIGGADFEIELKAKGLEHFEAVMEDLLKTFPGMIESYEFVAFKTEDKMVFLPDDF